MRAERNLSARTVEAYCNDITTYFADLRKKGVNGLETVAQPDVLEHLTSLSRRGLSRRSQARHLASLRMFHRFLQTEKVLEKDPTEDIDTPKLARKLPVFLTL